MGHENKVNVRATKFRAPQYGTLANKKFREFLSSQPRIQGLCTLAAPPYLGFIQSVPPLVHIKHVRQLQIGHPERQCTWQADGTRKAYREGRHNCWRVGNSVLTTEFRGCGLPVYVAKTHAEAAFKIFQFRT